MDSNSMSGFESLQLIDSMIKKARNRFSENGHLYLVWGWAVFAITLLHFLVDYYNWYDKPNMLWMLTFLPWVYMMFYLNKRQKKVNVRTYTEEIAAMVWVAFAAMMFATGFILGSLKTFAVIYPMTLVMYGLPTFLSGYILRFRPLLLGGIGCWLLAVASTFVPKIYQVLFLTSAVLIAWIIPGYLLQRKFENEKE